ncbi:MAG: lamin tail domain-containing protein [Candidatus Marinimicrobia bacterium]|nr:lamin tail domain-containing protein [Candidatus Neomarinimicrobiota bacterium]
MKKMTTMMTIMALLVGMAFSQGLFFSEYQEGSSNNKALEIYNPTDQIIDLSGYAFPNVSNAPAVPGEYEYWNTFAAGATIAPGDVYVVTHGSADPAMLMVGDMTHNYLSNGDDGFCLVQGDEVNFTVLDCIGDWNADPGSGWDVAGIVNATQNHTLVRKDAITQGNLDWASSAGTDADNSEWIVYDQNTFSYLGWHITPPTGNWGCDDPTALNYNELADGCEDGTSSCCEYPVAATIYEIQGQLDASPLAGTGVITSGIVTGVSSSGIFLQDGDGAWNGVWCYLGSGNTADILVGDAVEVIGTVMEYFDLTEIDGSATVTSSGNALPIAAALATVDVAEAYEGVLVSVSNAACDNADLGNGEWSVDDGSGSVVVDDKLFAFLPTLGTAYDVTGPVDFTYSAFKIQPRDASDIAEYVAPGPVSITFQVDMQYQEVSVDGVHIAGAFQGWDPAASECTLVSDAIYAATFELNSGDYHEYKFVNGNAWGSDEGVQRNITVPDANTVLDPVFFNDYEEVAGAEPVNVTFNLNTSTMPGYTDSTNTIVIRGSLNGWGGNEWELMNVGGDYWSYTTVTPLDPANYEYKYVNLTLAGDEWESLDNRPLVVTGLDGDQNQAVDYYNSAIPPFVETDGIDVYFRVSTLGIPGYAGDEMYTAGSFEGWSGTLMTDEGTSEYWGLSFSFDIPTAVEYKFQHGVGGWEGTANRTANITQDTTLAFAWWDDIAPSIEETVTKTLIFQTDMSEWLDEAGATGMPVFSLARNDTMEVRGGFNGWNDNDISNSVMVRQPGTNIFSLPVSITNYPSLTTEYKYFIKHSAESVLLFESEHGPMYVDMGWEDSPQYGGSNRTFSLGDSDNDIYQLPLAGYYDLPSGGTIPAGQQVVATYTIDMNDAGASGFVSGDIVRMVLKDKWNNYLQGFGNEFATIAVDNGDGTYSATVTLTGPAPWHTIYAWEFEGVEFSLQEGGGFGFGRFRARYMCPTDGVWTDWAFPTDIWTEEPPLFVEDFQGAQECLGVCTTDGDVTGDGSLNVLDIVAVVSHVLGLSPIADDMVCHGDMDTDGTINILDIVIMVDIILNQGPRQQSEATGATILNRDGEVSLESDGFIGGVQMTLSHGDNFSLTMTDGAYMAESHTVGNETTLIVIHPSGALFSTTDTFSITDYTVVNGHDYIPATIAGSYALLSNYPNPFNPVTEINYYLPASGLMSVSVYNMLGQQLVELANGNVEAGNYTVKWNGSTATGEKVPSGIYFVKLQHSEGVKTHKITLLK